MKESKQEDGEGEPDNQQFFDTMNPTGQKESKLTFADLQSSYQQSVSSSQQGTELPLRKMPSNIPDQGAAPARTLLSQNANLNANFQMYST